MRHPSYYWHRQKDLNPRLSVLETDALPTELYLHIIVDTRGLEPHSQDFQSCAYTMSAKCPLKRKQKDSNFRSLFEARPLSRGLVSTAHPCFLPFDTAKLDRPNAAYLRSQEQSSKNTEFRLKCRFGTLFIVLFCAITRLLFGRLE